MADHDIAVVMVTVDRSPGPNYLSDTITNLDRGGLFNSPSLHSLHVVDSGGPDEGWLEYAICVAAPRRIHVHQPPPGTRRSANRNVADALRIGGVHQVGWVLFIEDDIDVCGNFLDSVGEWLDVHGEEKYPVYAFGANYVQVKLLARDGAEAWPYPVRDFYGTQCFAVRPWVAIDLADWLVAHEFSRNPDGTAYDLHMHDWAEARGVTHFLASCPSFVEHIGRTSIINPRSDIHRFPSWPGREWRYKKEVTA